MEDGALSGHPLFSDLDLVGSGGWQNDLRKMNKLRIGYPEHGQHWPSKLEGGLQFRQLHHFGCRQP